MKTPLRVFHVFVRLAFKALRGAEQLRITMTCIAPELSPSPMAVPELQSNCPHPADQAWEAVFFSFFSN